MRLCVMLQIYCGQKKLFQEAASGQHIFAFARVKIDSRISPLLSPWRPEKQTSYRISSTLSVYPVASSRRSSMNNWSPYVFLPCWTAPRAHPDVTSPATTATRPPTQTTPWAAQPTTQRHYIKRQCNTMDDDILTK
jgi:hypothetical protein